MVAMAAMAAVVAMAMVEDQRQWAATAAEVASVEVASAEVAAAA